jgi:hypothetical protein
MKIKEIFIQRRIKKISKWVILLLPVIYLNSFCSYGQTITVPVFSKSSYVKYEKAEATFTLNTTYSNPYDSAVIQVDAIITPPSGPAITVPCFYYVPAVFNGGNATLNNAGATWMLRYAPTQTGSYSVKIRAIPNGNTGTQYFSPVATNVFTVTAGTLPGFIRLDASNKQFYRFDNGTPYYPVGLDIAWNDGTLLPGYYTNYFNSIGNNGISWMRYWLTDFARQALEWSSGQWSGFYGGLGVYSQQSAGMLDSVINACNENNIYMQLTLQHHGQFSTSVNPEWSGNPYNTANGGIINDPCLFFTDVASIGQAKKQYRYIIARWGYSTNIFAWELFNEVNETSTNAGVECVQASIVSWHNTMSAYFKAVDINKRLVTSSCGDPGDPILAAMDGTNTSLDILQFHDYPGSPVEVPVLSDDITSLSYTKASLCGEFGLSGNYNNTAPVWNDNDGDHVRKTMWIGMMNKVPDMFWYWDGYIDSKNLYTMFTPFNIFMKSTDIVTQTGATTTNFRLTTNPSIVTTITATPSNSSAWPCINGPNPWTGTVDANGNITGLNGLCPYQMGSWQGTGEADARFTVTFQAAGTATANLVGSSGSGTNSMQVSVDGGAPTTFSIPNGASTPTPSVSVPAGTHTVRFYNSGQDWLQVSNFSFTNVQEASLQAYGYIGSKYAYGYVYDKSYGAWANTSSLSSITTAVIRIGSLTPGSYQVDFFDPQAGSTFYSGGTYTSVSPNDSITVLIPSFKKDIAFRVYPAGTLPVQLLNFTGELKGDGSTLLNWITGAEKNTSVFEVQKSPDGNSFITIGTVPAYVNSSGSLNYTYTDVKPFAGSNYYRLKMVDLNGSSSYSNVVSLFTYTEQITVYPNPANNVLHINIPAPQDTLSQIAIINNLGIEVLSESVKLNKGLNIINLDISHLSSAMYFMKFSGIENATVVKLIKD